MSAFSLKLCYLRNYFKLLFMNNIFRISLLLLFIASFASCGGSKEETPKTEFGIRQLNNDSPDCDQYVLMETSMGNIKLKLYKETPLHRSNFVNLVKNGFYDGQLFFRVSQDFMIQAGDPESKEQNLVQPRSVITYRWK